MTLFNAQKLFLSAPRTGDEAADRVRLLLSRLGNPERRFSLLPITGEKGKSSVVRMLAGILAHSDVPSVSVIYPCLDTPKDNVFVGDTPLSNEEFVYYTAKIAGALKEIKLDPVDSAHLPFFSQSELLFCLAVTVAADKGAKWLILEIPNTPFAPLATVRFSSSLTVITSCSPTIPETTIGMIHPGLTEVVSARLASKSAYTELSAACAKAGCRLTVPAFSGLSVTESSLRRTAFTYRSTDYEIPLYGESGLSNALCAIEAATALVRLGCKITPNGIAEGLSRANLPARTEILSVSPTVIVDAADESFSTFTLADTLKGKGTAIGSRVTLCVEESADDIPFYTETFEELLSDAGFRFTGVVRIPKGKENRVAALLLNTAKKDDLLLTVGTLPFAFTMRNEFLKVLKAK